MACLEAKHAYLRFTGEMLEAFIILTDSMTANGNQQLLSHGKFQQTYAQGANELKEAPDFEATEFNCTLAAQLNKDLAETAKPNTPAKIEPFMKSMVDICANYLAQNAEFNKDKGPAFKALVKQMKTKGGAPLYAKGKAKRSYGTAATELEKARGLETDHDDPTLTQEIHGKLTTLMASVTPPELKAEMPETLDICSKYLSQRAIDEIERGPAFDLLIKTLEQQGGKRFTPEHPPLATQYAAAYTLKSAPGLGNVKPDPKTAPKFMAALHKEVDADTPPNLRADMNEVVERCGNYLSGFIRDRDKAVEIVVKTMKSSPTKELSKRNNYAMNYGTGATETETTPMLVPYLPIKDIADEHNEKLTKDVAPNTPAELKFAVKSAVTDVSKHLSQPVAVRSGAAGVRYPLALIGKMMESLGDRPLFKHKAYGQTYGDAAEVLKYAGPLDSSPKAENLKIEISTEMNKGIPTRTAPTIVNSMTGTTEDASKHLAKLGHEKGEALDYLVQQMKTQGDTHLEKLQGYDQTYNDGARRIENSDSLASPKVDKAAYQSVRNKLTAINAKSPNPEYAAVMPGVIDETSKFLAAPYPETEADKRRILRDLMGREGDKVLASEGNFRMNYAEGGKEVLNAPVGVHTAVDPKSKKDVESKINDVVPGDKLKTHLRVPASEGAAHISDIVKGRAEAMDAIKTGLRKEGGAEFLKVGKFDKTYAGAAEMLNAAPSFGGERPNGILRDKVQQRIEAVDKGPISAFAALHMQSAMNLASNYIADVATKECGLDPKQIAEWEASGGGVMKRRDSTSSWGTPGDVKSKLSSLSAMDAKSRAAFLEGLDEKSRLALLEQERLKSVTGMAGMSDEEEARRRAVEARRRAEEARRGTDETARRGTDEEAPRGTDEEARRRAEEEAPRGTDEARRGTDEEARRRAEEDARRRAEEETRRRAEEEARKRVGGEARRGTDEEARRRVEEEARRRADEEARRRAGGEARRGTDEEARRRAGGEEARKRDASSHAPVDPEHEEALKILRKHLSSKGVEPLYKQPLMTLSHIQAADWLSEDNAPKVRVGKAVKESNDTARLHQKFERKLSDLVSTVTPAPMKETMQDVVIESSRILSEYFVASNYKALVKDALIAEMQKHGNEIIIDDNGATETSIFAAQRLKKAKDLDVTAPTKFSHGLRKKMDDIIKCRSLARKLTESMKDHIKDSADYLSTVVLTPDEQIEAYVALLAEMDEMDDTLLIEGNIPKSYKDSATYLRSLTKCEDEIAMPNSSLQGVTEAKLNALMQNVPPRGYTPVILKTVITEQTRLLVSYIMLQGERTNALNVIVRQLDAEPEGLLLRHGVIRKLNTEGAELLRGKNTDQLIVVSADPVVTRKVQIKLTNLMEGNTPTQFANIMDDVISDATRYLAVELLKPHVIRVCKCMKSVFVQCELWCDEILRRVARPCCTCTRHVSAQAIADLAPAERLRVEPGVPRASAPGLDLTIRPCPAHSRAAPRAGPSQPCPAPGPSTGCDTANYMLYATQYDRRGQYVVNPTRLPRSASETVRSSLNLLPSQYAESSLNLKTEPSSGTSSRDDFFTPLGSSKSSSDYSPVSNPSDWNISSPDMGQTALCIKDEPDRLAQEPECSDRRSARTAHSPIVATDQMADWHAMMVSLTWNVQAWRNWIQETIDRALVHHHTETNESWSCFRRRIVTEALQWRQYNLFSRQLTLRLALRYRDKKIVSPTRATVKTPVYMECQKEMLDIINMFNRWTQWLSLVVKETDSLKVSQDFESSQDHMQWNYFKNKVQQYADDWLKYNTHLKLCWEQQYMSLIKGWLPSWNQQGPVWVMSACGAVPSGAARAGEVDGEPAWVARTTHRGRVLPAALRPSRHCCLLYADGAVHHYTKYQVMCNANVAWIAWRAGAVGARAVRIAPGVHAGRVLYRGSHLLGAVHAPSFRCHVVIFGRPFAFNCYELLVLVDE